MSTDTNQASEETIHEIFEGLARYNCNAFTQDTLPNEIPPYAAKERVLALLRNEKLKLLAEVRERVQVNQKGQFEEDSTGNVCWYLDNLVEALKELEAEL